MLVSNCSKGSILEIHSLFDYSSSFSFGIPIFKRYNTHSQYILMIIYVRIIMHIEILYSLNFPLTTIQNQIACPTSSLPWLHYLLFGRRGHVYVAIVCCYLQPVVCVWFVSPLGPTMNRGARLITSLDSIRRTKTASTPCETAKLQEVELFSHACAEEDDTFLFPPFLSFLILPWPLHHNEWIEHVFFIDNMPSTTSVTILFVPVGVMIRLFHCCRKIPDNRDLSDTSTGRLGRQRWESGRKEIGWSMDVNRAHSCCHWWDTNIC